MNTIIVPVDFSEHSTFALKAAAQLAKKNNAKIIALHMLELSETFLTRGEATHTNESIFYYKLAKQKFEEFLEQDYLKDVSVIPLVKHYKVFSEVNDVAKENNADLIVMGSHGSNGFSELFVGSNTEKVVRHSDIPVLVIKEETDASKFDNIVFASDFTDEVVTPFIKANALFKKLGAKLNLVYVNTPGDYFLTSAEMRKKVDTFLETTNCKNDVTNISFVSDFTVEKGVLNYANETNMDAISVATHGRTGISHFFSGSISEDIANHATKPVITFKI
jgi:nucleotide-binding universal stress UspA family protein